VGNLRVMLIRIYELNVSRETETKQRTPQAPGNFRSIPWHAKIALGKDISNILQEFGAGARNFGTGKRHEAYFAVK
jgi:hypothetical protein